MAYKSRCTPFIVVAKQMRKHGGAFTYKRPTRAQCGDLVKLASTFAGDKCGETVLVACYPRTTSEDVVGAKWRRAIMDSMRARRKRPRFKV